MYKKQQITKLEFENLLLDLTRLTAIQEEMFDVDVKKHVYDGFRVLLALKTVISV